MPISTENSLLFLSFLCTSFPATLNLELVTKKPDYNDAAFSNILYNQASIFLISFANCLTNLLAQYASTFLLSQAHLQESPLYSCFHKNIINCFNCHFKVFVLHTNNDVKLGRPLVNHFDIDICMC